MSLKNLTVFPSTEGSGIQLRDYVAIEVLKGLVNNPNLVSYSNKFDPKEREKLVYAAILYANEYVEQIEQTIEDEIEAEKREQKAPKRSELEQKEREQGSDSMSWLKYDDDLPF